jgi:hypothetical protein
LPDSSLAPFWSDSKTGQITRHENRTDHELTTFLFLPLAPAPKRTYHEQYDHAVGNSMTMRLGIEGGSMKCWGDSE